MRRLLSHEATVAAVATALCCWALYAQQRYRIAAGTPEWAIAWTGMALALFAACLTVRGWIEGRLEPGHQALSLLDRAATAGLWLVGAYVLWSAVLAANAMFDSSSPVTRRATIAALSRSEAFFDSLIPIAWADLVIAGSPGATRVLLTAEEATLLWGGEAVEVTLYEGAFGLPRIALVTRDEEARHRAVLAISPQAATSWAALASLYAKRQEWPQALDAARTYLQFSANVSPVESIAAERFQRSDYARSVQFYRLVFERSRSFKSEMLLGWTLAKLGRHDEALPLLEEAVRMNPETFWGYYHLAYAYQYAGKAAPAAEMFREVLKRRPNFPEIQQQLRQLGR